jgi:hypothetical protein
MYWTKNGSIPSQTTDGTEGWQQASEPPAEVPDDKELVWLNWEWIIRDPKPADRVGYQWNWNHADKSWVESAWQTSPESLPDLPVLPELTTSQVSNFTTSQML